MTRPMTVKEQPVVPALEVRQLMVCFAGLAASDARAMYPTLSPWKG